MIQNYICCVNNTNKKVIFKNFAASNYCISEINKTQVNNAQDMMPIYNSIEYSNVYLKKSGSL